MRVASNVRYPRVVGLLRVLADALDFEVSSSQFVVHGRRVPSGTLLTSIERVIHEACMQRRTVG